MTGVQTCALPISPGTRPDEVKQVTALLVEAAKTMELLEPFGRIGKALLSLKEE